MELNERSMEHRGEHPWIKAYLKGNLDWEVLVDELGEDMARGVRIAENYFRECETTEEYVLNIVSDDIKNNGKIAQAVKSFAGDEIRKGK